MGGNRRATNAKFNGAVAPLATVHSEDIQNGTVLDSDSKDEDLRKWLSGKEDSLLSWLNEDDSNEGEGTDSFMEVEEVLTEDAAELKSKADGAYTLKDQEPFSLDTRLNPPRP